ncbi:MAG: IS3 family transposase [Desulfitobacterium sp.]|uniref:IS3 family transposase n=1 Tax=Desulfitobacterium sp. THU1 TaxID=3138072 RepID=UPI00311F2257
MAESKLTISQQAELLSINRTSLYYKPVEPNEDDIRIKNYIDKVYTCCPEFGYRRICQWLNRYERAAVNYKAVLRHMCEVGIQAVYHALLHFSRAWTTAPHGRFTVAATLAIFFWDKCR